MQEDQFSRINILFQQRNYKQAEKSLKTMLSSDPNDVDMLSLLAEVYIHLERYDDGMRIIKSAIALDPSISILYYTKSRLELLKDLYDDAEKSILEAKILDPNDDDVFAFEAHIKLHRKKYDLALELADQSLQINPENLLALNTRSTALLKLGRQEESFTSIEGALREDPNNSFTHANYGWGLLEKGQHKKALDHFKEALANDPNSKHAQSGMLEALKARYLFYRIFLKYAFWMNKFSSKGQWGIIIGIYFLSKLLKVVAKSVPILLPVLIPIIVLLGLATFSTWIITPISNLFLRFNKYGNLLLDSKQRISSNFVGLSLLVAIFGLLLSYIFSDMKLLSLTVFGIAMILPLGVMLSPSKSKYFLIIYTVFLAITGIVSIYYSLLHGEIINLASIIFLFAFIAFQWISNFILIDED
jgi:Flp pilus assembly protein TadD